MKPAKPPAIRLSGPAKPAPVVVQTVCSLCGLAWESHGERPTAEDCVRLLKAELVRRPTPYVQPYIYPTPYVQPWWDYSKIVWGGSKIVYGNTTTTGRITINTPEASTACLSPISG